MFNLEQADHNALSELNSTYQIRHRGSTGGHGEQILADIICNVTKQVYATAEGATELLAVQAAIEKAKTATKPYATREAAKADQLREENAQLKRELEQAKASEPDLPSEEDERTQLKARLDAANVRYGPKCKTDTLRRLARELEGAPA